MRRILASGMTCAMLAGAALLAVPASAPRSHVRRPSEAPVTGDITMVQANIYTGLSVERFQADVRTVLAAPARLRDLQRGAVPQRRGDGSRGLLALPRPDRPVHAATPVAWRTDRWTAIDHGLLDDLELARQASGPGGRARAAGGQLGDPAGRRRPGRVAWCRCTWRPWSAACRTCCGARSTGSTCWSRSSRPAGPVLVGGDFNVHYPGAPVPARHPARPGWSPTYDVLGTYFPTGDHSGRDHRLRPRTAASRCWRRSHQYPVELNSDHDAVVGGLSWVDRPPADHPGDPQRPRR